MLVKSQDPANVPIIIPTIITQNLLIKSTNFGPVNNCQTLVTKDGMISNDAALSGDMMILNIPIAMVGNPIPATPLTNPATKNVININKKFKVRNSIILKYLVTMSRHIILFLTKVKRTNT